MKVNKILIVTHDTSLSGAPKMLLLLWEQIIKKNKNISLDVLSMSDNGILSSRFKSISKNFYSLYDYPKEYKFSFFEKILNRLKVINLLTPREKLVNLLISNDYNLIFANTVVTIPLVSQISGNSKIIVNVHELDTVIEEYLPDIQNYDHMISKYIVPSNLNKNVLTKKGILNAKIQIIRDSSSLEYFNREFKFEDGSKFRVLGCGAAYWRKGDDLFIQLASSVVNKNPFIKFYWVGPQSVEKRRVNIADVRKLNLENHLFFIDEVEFNDLLNQMDVFALTSREDPFPLAAVESGLYGLPITCFENATGISEVISEDMIAPYLNVNQMANIILDIYDNVEKYKFESKKNSLEFQQFLPENISEQLMKVINFELNG